MGLANWGRPGVANSSPDPWHRILGHGVLGHRPMPNGMAALLAGAAAIALLTPSANAQSANAQQANAHR
ncbi:hypothetical protein MES4922_300120 [Mesorhizobium ventifaucium]|uniref:Uncharacterized protein n=1 Tax=Mesorhizobium ventifaucium TaxID=666020 RepID=A0ABN8K0C0_9HYPH|nr:hypothetical protein MES4922_300120 [Mesorhizobium ventifaucium]